MEKFEFKSFPKTYFRVLEVRELLPKLIERGRSVSADIAARNDANGENYSPEYYLGDTQDAYLCRLYNIYGDDIVCWALAYPWMDEGYAPTYEETLNNLAPTT